MALAAQKLVGEHDYRNFCKMDINNGVTNYMRRIMSFTVEPSSKVQYVCSTYISRCLFEMIKKTNAIPMHAIILVHSYRSDDPNNSMWEFTIHGTAFLWHQVIPLSYMY